ncbi:MAG: hypothetical protein JWM78_2445 [Verrucomicrobiaceae bacterium]|nr:hypothetical protein [Verrucomicrobiaceae bacterium]
MSQLLRSYTTVVWVVLVLLTGFSWWLGHSSASIQYSKGPQLATVFMFLVALFKVRLVGLNFMELKHAPLPLRLLFELWGAGVCIAIVCLYWFNAA